MWLWIVLELVFFCGSLAVGEYLFRREALKTDPFVKPSAFLTSEEFE